VHLWLNPAQEGWVHKLALAEIGKSTEDNTHQKISIVSWMDDLCLKTLSTDNFPRLTKY
jgi:hypothetical protein